MTSALDGIRVLDLSQGSAGPLAGMILSDNGAEVIRVEPPGGSPHYYEPGYLVWNRGKRSVTLDLKSSQGRENFLRLVETADVLIETFRPGVTKRLGIDYDTLSQRNPGLVYTTITGYGSSGPLANRPGYDALIQAKCGFQLEQPQHSAAPSINRDGPIMIGITLPSMGAYMMALYGSLAALYAREFTGEGQHVETSLFQGMLLNLTMHWWQTEVPFPRSAGSYVNGKRTPYLPTIFESKDGVWFYNMGTRRFPQEFNEFLGLESAPQAIPHGVSDEEQYAMYHHMAAAYRKKTWKELDDAFERLDCIVLPVQPAAAAFDDEQIIHNKYIVEVDDPKYGRLRQVGIPYTLEGCPPRVQGPARRLGEDTDAVLAELDSWKRKESSGAQPKKSLQHALEGVNILDMGDFLAGPLGPQVMADLGASVIKLERCTGDPMHGIFAFLGCHRGKRAIGVDLYTDEGREIAYKLAANADIVHQNWRPKVAERLKVDYEALRRHNAEIIYCHNVPFGFDGPRAHRGALDQIMQAYCGTLERVAGKGNPPTTWLKTGTGDYVQALSGGLAMMLALYHKARTGKGQFMGSRMIDAGLFLHSEVTLGGNGVPKRTEIDSEVRGIGPLYRLYKGSEGWICVVVVQEKEWQALCRALGDDYLAKDPRFTDAASRKKNGDALGTLLDTIFATKTAEDWFSILDKEGVPCEVSKFHYGPEGCDFFQHPDAIAHGWTAEYQHSVLGKMYQPGLPVNLSKTPGKIQGPPPALGEHTREIMQSVGYTDAEIDDLKARGVINWEHRA